MNMDIILENITVNFDSNGYKIVKQENGTCKYKYSVDLGAWGKLYLFKIFKSVKEAKEYVEPLKQWEKRELSAGDFYLRKDFNTGEHYLALRKQFSELETISLA